MIAPRFSVIALIASVAVPFAATAESYVCALKPEGSKWRDFVPTSLTVRLSDDQARARIVHSGSSTGDQVVVFADVQSDTPARVTLLWDAPQQNPFKYEWIVPHKLTITKGTGDARFRVAMRHLQASKGRGTCTRK